MVLAGKEVSLDALHTPVETARALVLEHGADYLLTVRCNQSIGQLGYIPIELQRVIEWVNDEFLGVPVREALLVALPG